MDAPGSGRPPGLPVSSASTGATDGRGDRPSDEPADGPADESDDGGPDDGADADLVVDVLHRVGRCSVRALGSQPELGAWSPVRLEKAVVRAWNGGLVFIDRNDDLVAL